MYHRIAEGDIDPWGLCVSPRNFGAHLEVLADRLLLLTMDDVSSGELPRRRAVVVTVDDGYGDTRTAAAPLFRQYGVPVIVYVMTGGFSGGVACWWDVLAELLLRPRSLPRNLPPELRTPELESLLAAARTLTVDDARRYSRWSAYDAPPTARHTLYMGLWRRLIEAPSFEQPRMIRALGEWVTGDATPEARLLNAEDVAFLHAEPLITIGAHTVRHLALPRLDVDEQRKEMLDSAQELQDVTGSPILHFAYPYGRYDSVVSRTARMAGFVTSVTTDPGLVGGRSDLFVLPRFQVPDIDGERFELWLDSIYTGDNGEGRSKQGQRSRLDRS